MSGRWLLGAFLATLVAAAICVYLAICGMFYVGQWQFVFQPPKPSMAALPSTSQAMPLEDIRFDYTETGLAQLDGWWIPAGAGAQHANAVLLICHSGNTSLAQELPMLQNLHSLGVNVFAFDYRGFGNSVPIHPSEHSVYADGIAALRYLTDTRHIAANRVFVYGDGIGAAVAVHLAQSAPQLSGSAAGVILENAKTSLLPQMLSEPRLQYLPVRLLFHNRFDIQGTVQSLENPKLFLVTDAEKSQPTMQLFQDAAPPKQMIQVHAGHGLDWAGAITSFLSMSAH